jgi:beta-hydroxylase
VLIATAALLALVLVGCALYVQLRGKVRFKPLRMLTDYSNWLSPYNAFACLCSATPARARQELDRFPELAPLQAHWQEIRDEALALFHDGLVQRSPRGDDLVFHAFFKRGWKRFYLRWYGDPLPSAQRRCPRTLELLAGIPSVRGAMFASMEPRSRIGAHRDPFAGTLRYHLGLFTPNSEACRIFIDGEPYVWRDGEAVLFDSTYIHKARNDTDLPRLILFCDVERPMRNRLATGLNRLFLRRVVPITRTPNEPGDPVGLGNRVFPRLHPALRAFGGLRTRSPSAYRALKFGLPAAVLGAAVALAAWWIRQASGSA